MKKLCVVAVLLMAIGAVQAATVWNPAANPSGLGSMNWSDVGNWTNGIPVLVAPGQDKAVFNVAGALPAIITDAQEVKLFVQGDNADGGQIHITDGGSLTTGSNWSAVGYNSTAYTKVHSGGTLTFGQHAWIGLNDGGVGTLDIAGTVNVTAMLGLGWGGGQGFVNVLEGGVLDLHQMHGDGQTSVKNGSLLNIEGTDVTDSGYVILPGDYTGVVQAYMDNGLIAGNGIIGNVTYDLTTTPGSTTVYVPEPATMILLGLGGLLLRKRR